jgi:hypothetical protein
MSDRSYGALMKILVDAHTNAMNRKIGGAKFPVNIGYAPILFDWFPGCQIIHLVRDPRAIYTSMVKVTLNRSSHDYPMKKLAAQSVRLPYILHQFRHATRFHHTYRGCANYYCLKFEELVNNPEEEISRLCAYTGIDYTPEMLNPPTGVGSKYADTRQQQLGFDTESLNRWKTHIPSLARKLLEFLLRSEMLEMGYR